MVTVARGIVIILTLTCHIFSMYMGGTICSSACKTGDEFKTSSHKILKFLLILDYLRTE